jgi:hypothetical protein
MLTPQQRLQILGVASAAELINDVVQGLLWPLNLVFKAAFSASCWKTGIALSDNAAIDAATHDPTVGQLRPIAGAHNTGIPCAHIQFPVGIAAEGTGALKALEIGVRVRIWARPAHSRLAPKRSATRMLDPTFALVTKVPISTAPERELPLANPMGKLDSGQCNGRTPERLEASHRGASAFDRSMILLKRPQNWLVVCCHI